MFRGSTKIQNKRKTDSDRKKILQKKQNLFIKDPFLSLTDNALYLIGLTNFKIL